MPHLLIDALSVNNFSGRHVLTGHVRQMRIALPDWRLSMLVQQGQSQLALDCDVAPLEAPVGVGALGRVWFTQRHLRQWTRDIGADLLFTPAGMLTAGCPLPQIVLAQNPWPLVDLARGRERVRTYLQRHAFAAAQRRARVMVYNSRYMQALYAAKLGERSGASLIAYQGIDERYFDQASPCALSERRDLVLVSVMAAHKAVEDAVAAFALANLGHQTRLRLIGPWPDVSYRRQIERIVAAHGLAGRVVFEGEIASAGLLAAYRYARAFVLLSRCESFGIPAIEAQSQGTPTIVAMGTAAPEVAGAGGLVVPSGAVGAAAQAMTALMSDDALWHRYSHAALDNAGRFRFTHCSAPLIDALRELTP